MMIRNQTNIAIVLAVVGWTNIAAFFGGTVYGERFAPERVQPPAARQFVLQSPATSAKLLANSTPEDDIDIRCQRTFHQLIGDHASRGFELRQERLLSDFHTREYLVEVAYFDGDELFRRNFVFICREDKGIISVDSVVASD